MSISHDTRTRRAIIKTGGLLAGSLVLPHALAAAMRDPEVKRKPLTSEDLRPVRPAPYPKPYATARTSPRVVRPDLMRRAMAALDAHSHQGIKRDRIVIADFAAPSSQARFHFIDLVNGKSMSKLVSHGSGSDPEHTGWLQRFSNRDGSNATSEGAYRAVDYYVGKHGRSQRLIGLDHTNNNALQRAIVVHAAWYANPEIVRERGVLGRSQGCFAVGERELDEVFARLGQDRMIYAAKV